MSNIFDIASDVEMLASLCILVRSSSLVLMNIAVGGSPIDPSATAGA